MPHARLGYWMQTASAMQSTKLLCTWWACCCAGATPDRQVACYPHPLSSGWWAHDLAIPGDSG